MNWDDLRFFLAIARTRSLTSAAGVLKVSQPTVSRRLAAMETGFGARLFDRTRSGYELTAAGIEVFETVQHVDNEIADIARKLSGQDHRLTGPLRLTCTEVMANQYLIPHLRRFSLQHPAIELSIFCTFQHLSLSRRDADVAIRFTSQPPDTLIGRKLAKVALAAYTAANKASSPDMATASSAEWIGLQDETYNRILILNHFPDARIKHRVDDLQTMKTMVGLGLGVAALPCYMADIDPGLRRLSSSPITENVPDLWVLSHPDMRRVARVHLFTDFIAAAIQADRDLFEGDRPIKIGHA